MDVSEQTKFTIHAALISVSNKNNLAPIAQALVNKHIEILSSGGTATYLSNNNIESTEISEYINHPEILSGRVKTLHPKIHGGILSRKSNQQDETDLKQNNIKKINLVIVNLYPFIEQAGQLQDQMNYSSSEFIDKLIEYIDIGGQTLIRAAAKNYQDNIIITSPEDYSWLYKKLESSVNNIIDISLADRISLATKAFKHTAEYENAIFTAFLNHSKNPIPESLNINLSLEQKLRYGENPQQAAGVYKTSTKLPINPSFTDNLLQGKELSYNNLVDTDTAKNIITSLSSCLSLKNFAQCVIIKHATPCGIACADDIHKAYEQAFAADSLSAFGGIIAINKQLDEKLAATIIKNQFIEVLLAPSFTQAALELFKTKPNVRLIQQPNSHNTQTADLQLKVIANRILAQTKMLDDDLDNPDNFRIVTENKNLSSEQILDLKFSWYAVQHVKSNAIVIVNNRQTIGIGGGQTSRVGSLELALHLAQKLGHKEKLAHSVMASDAFFPFTDCIEIAAENGIKAIIQPGGSKADQDIINKANELGLTMIFTNKRKFYH